MEVNEVRRAKELGYKGTGKYIWHGCEVCGKERWVRLRLGKPVCSKCKTCGIKQAAMARLGRFRGVRSVNWQGGRCIKGNYVCVLLQPTDDFFLPMAFRRDRYIYEHRLVVAKHLNRCLLPWEVVHHKNGDKHDNRIENLELLPHNKYHLVDSTLVKHVYYLENKIEQYKRENTHLRRLLNNVGNPSS